MAIYLISFIFLLFNLSCSKPNTEASTTSATIKTLNVGTTDSTIQYNNTENHLYRECDNGTCQDDQLLFVFFPGSDGTPASHQKILEVIGKTGIRGLVLAYQNNGSLNSMCGTTDSCYTQARQDRVEGASSSSYVSSVSDGVKNRLLKALQTLGWTNFYTGSTLNMSKIIFGGFSQGAGIATWIGKNYLVHRICQFSGTWDHTTGTTSATWLSGASTTPASKFYGFTHQHDSLTNGYSYLDLNWQTLGMGAGTVVLYTSPSGQKLYANESDTICLADAHACSVQDAATPLTSDGSPKFSSAWKYVCGR